MALINCPECGRQISDRAPSCPGCGILKEDIQAMIAEKNAANSSMEQKRKSNNNDALESQGTEAEFLYYPTISAISQREKKQYNEKHGTKSQKAEWILKAEQTVKEIVKAEQTAKTGRAEEQFKVGEFVTFGAQEGEPIRWIVLETKGDDMLLLSEKCLEIRQYHSELKSVTWETSDIRRYLNGEFLERNFTDKARRIIKQSILLNPDNPLHGTRGGNCTLDKVFLLSIDEGKRYFPDKVSRVCEASEYARKQAGKLNIKLMGNGTIGPNYWLRSPGINEQDASVIYSRGDESTIGLPANYLSMIRPALVVHLDE